MSRTMKGNRGIFSLIIGPAVVILLIIIIISQMSKVSSTSTEEGMQVLRDSIQKAVISCYAEEGCYPPSVDYIKEKYGITWDEEQFSVFYEIFADNIMPEITVVPLE